MLIPLFFFTHAGKGLANWLISYYYHHYYVDLSTCPVFLQAPRRLLIWNRLPLPRYSRNHLAGTCSS